MKLELAIPALVFGASLVSPFAIVPLLRARGIIDHPNHRSSHVDPTVRGVGIAPLLGVLLALLLVATSGPGSSAPLAIAAAAVVLGLLGLAEDVRGLSVRVRMTFQLVIGSLFATAAIPATGWADRTGGSAWLAVPVLAVVLAGYVNVANFMDGIDSISALHAAVVGAHFAMVGWITGDAGVALVGAVIAAAFLGFAPWNLLRGRRVFLGDVGSYLLGGLVGCAAIWVALGTGNLLLAGAPTIPYLVDTVATVCRRARDREPLFEAHRTHTYQRVVATGVPHLVVGAGVAVLSAVCSGLALLHATGLIGLLPACALIVVTQIGYLTTPRILARRRLMVPVP